MLRYARCARYATLAPPGGHRIPHQSGGGSRGHVMIILKGNRAQGLGETKGNTPKGPDLPLRVETLTLPNNLYTEDPHR